MAMLLVISEPKFCSHWAAYSILVWQSTRKKWRYDFKPTKQLPVYHTGTYHDYRLTSSPESNILICMCDYAKITRVIKTQTFISGALAGALTNNIVALLTGKTCGTIISISLITKLVTTWRRRSKGSLTTSYFLWSTKPSSVGSSGWNFVPWLGKHFWNITSEQPSTSVLQQEMYVRLNRLLSIRWLNHSKSYMARTTYHAGYTRQMTHQIISAMTSGKFSCVMGLISPDDMKGQSTSSVNWNWWPLLNLYTKWWVHARIECLSIVHQHTSDCLLRDCECQFSTSHLCHHNSSIWNSPLFPRMSHIAIPWKLISFICLV